MGQRDLTFLLVPIVALFAILIPATGGGRADEAQGVKPADGAAASAPAAETTRRTAADLLNAYGGVSPAAKAEKCLVATLPDPVDAANLSYTYDRYLDGIQRAMEAAGYVLDRFDMPWLDKDLTAAAGPSPAGASEPRFRREPGRLLFRSATPGATIVPPAALVFVVGETPTAGLHKAAFSQAVKEFTASCADGAAGSIPVLGPSFSGSESSLHALLVAHASRRFEVITGSATAIHAGALTAGTQATFKATLAADVDARNHFLMNLADRERSRVVQRLRQLLEPLGLSTIEDRTKVALLVEANTSYGHEAVRGGQAARKVACPLPPDSPLVECIPETIDLIRLPFPLHIASLRGAARDAAQSPSAKPEIVPGRQALTDLNLRDAPAARTVLPLASRTETASIEIVLSTLLKTLEKEHVRYIGLVATDVQDRIFLSQQIRHHLPNSVLFMFSTDLLYLHPDANVDLRGAQVVTSYPLFSENQDWTPSASGPTARLLFPTHTTQGVYNAALALLGLQTSMQEYGYPLDSDKSPPLWLSIVGADGLWPVALLGEADKHDMVPAPHRPGQTRTLSTQNHPWMPAILLLACLVPALFAIVNFAPVLPRQIPRTALSRGPIAKLFSDTIFPGHRFGRRMYLMACFAALCSGYLLTVTLFLLPAIAHLANPGLQWRPAHLSWILELLLMLGLVIVVGTLALFARLVWLERDTRDRRRRLTRLLAMLAVAGG